MREEATAFKAARASIAHRLYVDAAFSPFDAMCLMVDAAETHVLSAAPNSEGISLWVSGSLGRREFLPNSDIDLFVIHEEAGQLPVDLPITDADKLEVAQLDISELEALVGDGSIDANRVIDGRGLTGPACNSITEMVIAVETVDRQFANLVSEYFYYHYFDFPDKRTRHGADLKYSAGSSRATLFFNFAHRIQSGEFPAERSAGPELLAALRSYEELTGVRAPLRAIETVLVAKSAAISCLYVSNDPQVKFVSSRSLRMLYELCGRRFREYAVCDGDEFERYYTAARAEIEEAIQRLIASLFAQHPAADLVAYVSQMQVDEIPSFLSIEADSESVATLSALATWRLATAGGSTRGIAAAAEVLMARSIKESWGGLMAIICSPTVDERTLERVLEWLGANEHGAYLTKLITRTPSASPCLKARALEALDAKEVFRTV